MGTGFMVSLLREAGRRLVPQPGSNFIIISANSIAMAHPKSRNFDFGETVGDLRPRNSEHEGDWRRGGRDPYHAPNRGRGRGDRNRGNQRSRAGPRSQSNTSRDQGEKRRQGGRGGHPSGLKGRDIGLWYAKQGQQRKKTNEVNNRKTISMNKEQIGQVNYVLYDARRSARGTGTPNTSSSTSVDQNDEDLYAAGEEWQELDDFLPVCDADNFWFESPVEPQENPALNERLREELWEKKSSDKYKSMLRFRKSLPSYDMKTDLIKMINDNQVIVISGETGCGKTTQVPQFILDDAIELGIGASCKVVCTQPRRISAISVAERVAEERAETCGADESCGYQIRLESKLPRKNASILYCTTGILLQRLKSDSVLQNVSHIVLDEIHERDLHTDFLLTIVKGILEKRKGLKVILMSATLNAEHFSSYFDNCPCFHIPGFTYPVESMYLEKIMDLTKFEPGKDAFRLIENSHKRRKWGREKYKHNKEEMDVAHQRWDDYYKTELQGKYSETDCRNLYAEHMYLRNGFDSQLIVATVKYIVNNQPPGAILIFVPGWMNIKNVNEDLMRDRQLSSSRFLIIPLHSMLPTSNQRQVFDRPPEGITKIVIATNIAETSITIDDIVHVVDTGKIKINEFDHTTNMASLQMKWVSRANAKQRKGRAGRVQEGFCYHLYTKLQETEFADYLLPEMLRTPLDQLCLQIRVLKLGRIEDFLAKVMEPPSLEAMNLSISKLTALSALDCDQNLTPLGYHLARLPVEPQIGKMILMGAMFACLDPILTIAASLSFKDPFSFPLGLEKAVDGRKKELADKSNSDHIMLFNVFRGWEEARNRGHHEENSYCWKNFLSKSTLMMLYNMKGQFAEHLHSIGFIPSKSTRDPVVNRLSGNQRVILAIVCSGLYPNICKISPASKAYKPPKLQTKTERKLDFHPKSVNAGNASGNFSQQWLCYYLKMRTNGVYLFDASEVSAYPLLFFGGKISTHFDETVRQDMIAVDDWIVFKSKPEIATLVQDLRKEMDHILAKKIRDPSVAMLHSRDSAGKVLSSIVDLITTET